MKIVSFFSAKGGVGKSSLVLNYSRILSKETKVIVIDYSLYGGLDAFCRVPKIDGKSLSSSITSFRQGLEHSDFMSILRESIYSYHANFDILFSASVLKMDGINADYTYNLLNTLEELGYDVIIFDLPSEINERSIAALESSDEIKVILTQDIYSVWKHKKCHDTLSSFNISNEKLKYVINRHDKKIQFSKGEYLDVLGVDDLTLIPDMGAAFSELLNDGKLIIEQSKNWRVKSYIKAMKEMINNG